MHIIKYNSNKKKTNKNIDNNGLITTSDLDKFIHLSTT